MLACFELHIHGLTYSGEPRTTWLERTKYYARENVCVWVMEIEHAGRLGGGVRAEYNGIGDEAMHDACE